MPHIRVAMIAGMRSPGFTLIELLVVIAIIVLLIGLLAGGGMVILQRARGARSAQTVASVVQAMLVYRDEDSRHRYPPALPDRTIRYDVAGPYAGGISRTASLLMAQGLAIHGELLERDADGDFLADAWSQPIRYQLDATVDGTPDRPFDDEGQPVRVPEDVGDWNPGGAQPYAYVWSTGRPRTGSGSRSNARAWIRHQESP